MDTVNKENLALTHADGDLKKPDSLKDIVHEAKSTGNDDGKTDHTALEHDLDTGEIVRVIHPDADTKKGAVTNRDPEEN